MTKGSPSFGLAQPKKMKKSQDISWPFLTRIIWV